MRTPMQTQAPMQTAMRTPMKTAIMTPSPKQTAMRIPMHMQTAMRTPMQTAMRTAMQTPTKATPLPWDPTFRDFINRIMKTENHDAQQCTTKPQAFLSPVFHTHTQ